MAALVDIRNVYKIFNPGENEVRALDGINLTIERGEFVAIIGQSGSGKSTLMNMIGLLDMCTSGEYYLDGQNVRNLSDDELSEIRNEEIGFVFQGYNLIPSLTAQANVELPLVYRGMEKAERAALAEDALTKVGLYNRRNHLPSQLSGGQQQRVTIARAIAARPPIVLADEPTGALDTKAGTQVLSLLSDLNAQGKTVILITHDPGIASKAKRIIRIQDGRIVEDILNNQNP